MEDIKKVLKAIKKSLKNYDKAFVLSFGTKL
jgi:hypothetical protein